MSSLDSLCRNDLGTQEKPLLSAMASSEKLSRMKKSFQGQILSSTHGSYHENCNWLEQLCPRAFCEQFQTCGANCQIAKPDEPIGWARTEFEFTTAPLKVPHDNKPITICNCVPAFSPERDVPRSLRASHSVDSESTALARSTKETAQLR